MKLSFYILSVLTLLLKSIYAYADTNEVSIRSTVGEYSYTLITNQNIYLDNENESITFMLERQEFPLVNRLVRFISFTPDIITFENDAGTIVMPTDERGIAEAKVEMKEEGRGIVGIHVLYVGSTGNTNITYNTFTTVQVEAKENSKENISNLASVIPNLVFVYIFMSPILILLIGYYNRLSREKANSEQNIIMSVLLGFSSVKSKFILMNIISLAVLLILAFTIFSSSILIPLALTLLSLSALSLKRTRSIGIVFLLLSLLTMSSLIFDAIILYSGVEISNTKLLFSNTLFVFFLFLITTAFLSGVYLPSLFLLVYAQVFSLNTISIIAGLLAIFVASVLYFVQYKYKKKTLPLFYIINILKIRN